MVLNRKLYKKIEFGTKMTELRAKNACPYIDYRGSEYF